MIRFGVCGTAFWSEDVHIPGLIANPEVDLVGVWGRSPERTRQLAQEKAIRPFASFRDMLDCVDAISFAVPPAAQAELALLAITEGKHVILEKPLAPTVAAAQAIVSAASDHDVSALCFLTRMFVEEVSTFAERARAMSPVKGEASFRSSALVQGPYSGSAWRQEEHGALWDAAPHGMSVLASVLGPIAAVSASTAPDGSYAIEFEHENGSTSTLDLNLRDTAAEMSEQYRFWNGGAIELIKPAYNRQQTFAYATELLLREIAGERNESNSRLGLGLHLVAVAAAAQQSLAKGGTSEPVTLRWDGTAVAPSRN